MPMTKGFPRPRKTVKQIRVGRWVLNKEWAGKSYPIPFSAKMNRVGHLCKSRVIECATKKLCIVCGEDVPGEDVWCYLWLGSLTADSGPFHEKCVRLTQKMCPVVSEHPDRFDFKMMKWSVVGPTIQQGAKNLSA